MKRIAVVGSFVTDMVATMERFPEAGETVLGKTMRFYPGGKGINQCVAARRLGADVSMIGMLGKDSNGNMFRRLMRKEKIDSKNVYISETEPTSMSQIQLNGQSQNRICVIPCANYAFGEKELEKAAPVIMQSSLVMVQLELRIEVVYRLIDLCFDHNIPLILNPAPAQKIEDKYYPKITYLTPNETELSFLSGIDTTEAEGAFAAAALLSDKGVKNIIATLGERGALLYTENRKEIIKSYHVKAVDTTAAGDCFNGALASCIVAGKDLRESVCFANAAGALAVTKSGAIPSLPYRKEVKQFLAEREK